eukprot:scaffold9190_cov91-Phaeocystis_antarctica.AAC.1
MLGLTASINSFMLVARLDTERGLWWASQTICVDEVPAPRSGPTSVSGRGTGGYKRMKRPKRTNRSKWTKRTQHDNDDDDDTRATKK